MLQGQHLSVRRFVIRELFENADNTNFLNLRIRVNRVLKDYQSKAADSFYIFDLRNGPDFPEGLIRVIQDKHAEVETATLVEMFIRNRPYLDHVKKVISALDLDPTDYSESINNLISRKLFEIPLDWCSDDISQIIKEYGDVIDLSDGFIKSVQLLMQKGEGRSAMQILKSELCAGVDFLSLFQYKKVIKNCWLSCIEKGDSVSANEIEEYFGKEINFTKVRGYKKAAKNGFRKCVVDGYGIGAVGYIKRFAEKMDFKKYRTYEEDLRKGFSSALNQPRYLDDSDSKNLHAIYYELSGDIDLSDVVIKKCFKVYATGVIKLMKIFGDDVDFSGVLEKEHERFKMNLTTSLEVGHVNEAIDIRNEFFSDFDCSEIENYEESVRTGFLVCAWELKFDKTRRIQDEFGDGIDFSPEVAKAHIYLVTQRVSADEALALKREFPSELDFELNSENVEELLKAFILAMKTSNTRAIKLILDEYGEYIDNPELKIECYNYLGFYDKSVFDKFVRLSLNETHEEAIAYLDSIIEKTSSFIDSRTPKSSREDPLYEKLIQYTFPNGTYSSYDRNLSCDDKLEHLESYEFDKVGYPVQLSGLLGYELKEGETENIELLKSYQKRLGEIRSFVTKRGPNNEKLQEDFEKKVDELFSIHVHDVFSSIVDLSAKEKLLCLIISEAYRKGSKKDKFTQNATILDLVVEYKYAYSEDLEAYIQRSADGVKQHKDKTSQNRALWNELSTIYGENLKHVLRHDIFEELAENGDHYNEILSAYETIYDFQDESQELKPKQLSNIENTFNNPKIPEEKKFDVLLKQLIRIFSTNIDFKNKKEKETFIDELTAITEQIKSNITSDEFTKIVPELFALRDKYRLQINTKIEELFSLDINAIFRELSKYDEKIEVEAKETRMGGEKHKESKKSVKKRNIRGYFTKTQETANARMGAYLCIAGDKGMWDNKNYFELVLQDEDTNKCVGTVMLLNIEAKNGKKYLWFGPNPFESFLYQVSSEKCYNYMYDTVIKFAEENGFDGVVVPAKEDKIRNECTNRGGDFPGLVENSRLRDKKDGLKIVEFGSRHELSRGYGYDSGALIWERK